MVQKSESDAKLAVGLTRPSLEHNPNTSHLPRTPREGVSKLKRRGETPRGP
jgi:hypothetical protein